MPCELERVQSPSTPAYLLLHWQLPLMGTHKESSLPPGFGAHAKPGGQFRSVPQSARHTEFPAISWQPTVKLSTSPQSSEFLQGLHPLGKGCTHTSFSPSFVRLNLQRKPSGHESLSVHGSVHTPPSGVEAQC